MFLLTRFFSLDDIYLVPLCLIILYAIIRYRAEKNKDQQIKQLYYRGFYFKVFFVFAYTFITEFYFKGGDTSLYYQGVKDLRAAVASDFDNLGTIIISLKLNLASPLAPFFYYDNFADDFIFGIMQTTGNFFIPRLGLLPSYIFFNSYLCISLVFGFFALSGAIKIFKVFHYYYPFCTKEIALAAIFIPSVGFWSAGLLKDPICFGCLGFILYGVHSIFIRKINYISSIIIILACFFLLYHIKVYILLTLLLGIIVWLFAETNILIKDRTLRNLFSFMTLVLSGFIAYFLLNYFTSQEAAQQYKIDTLFEKAEGQRQVIHNIGEMVGPNTSNFTINTSNPIILIFNSIVATFFRPFVWEINTPIALFSSLESAVFLLLTLNFFLKEGIGRYFRIIFSDPRMLMCFIFSIIFAIAVGASTSNFGALSRYKIPCMPFYFIMLLMVYKKASLAYPKWFNRILRKVS
jgi:hypothetical protein